MIFDHRFTMKTNTAAMIDATWIPAHPVYGGVSMRRYTEVLTLSDVSSFSAAK